MIVSQGYSDRIKQLHSGRLLQGGHEQTQADRETGRLLPLAFFACGQFPIGWFPVVAVAVKKESYAETAWFLTLF